MNWRALPGYSIAWLLNLGICLAAAMALGLIGFRLTDGVHAPPAMMATLTAFGAAFGIAMGIPHSRLALSVFPPLASGERRDVVCIGLLCFLIMKLVTKLPVAYRLIDEVASSSGPLAVEDVVITSAIDGMFVTFGVTWASLALTRHVFTDRPFRANTLLFLRRFADGSDRSVLGAIIRATPGGLNVTMLADPNRGLMDWDPIVIGWTGYRPFRLRARRPEVLIGDSVEWRSEVRRLAAQSSVIIVDLSSLGPGLRDELEILQELGAVERTRIICRKDRVDEIEGNWRSRVLPYVLGVRWTVPLLGAVFLLGLTSAFVAVTPWIAGSSPEFTSRFHEAVGLQFPTGPAAKAISAAAGVILFLVSLKLTVRRQVPRSFERSMRAVIEQIASTTAPPVSQEDRSRPV